MSLIADALKRTRDDAREGRPLPPPFNESPFSPPSSGRGRKKITYVVLGLCIIIVAGALFYIMRQYQSRLRPSVRPAPPAAEARLSLKRVAKADDSATERPQPLPKPNLSQRGPHGREGGESVDVEELVPSPFKIPDKQGHARRDKGGKGDTTGARIDQPKPQGPLAKAVESQDVERSARLVVSSGDQRILIEKAPQRKMHAAGPETSFARAMDYQMKGQYQEAIQAYKRTLEAEPWNARAYINLGNIFSRLGNTEEALECYRKAVEIDPGSSKGYNNLAVLLYRTGKFLEALRFFRRALEKDPDNPDTYINYGVALKKLGRRQEAEEAFRKALSLEPRQAEAHYNLALLLEEEGRLEEAIDSFETFAELSEETRPLIVSKVRAHLRTLQGKKRSRQR